ncbi:MAG: hypothetical protein U5K28_04190 [Halobacteriales archaeon]|nr:hypothetical protein [Halobacteriales archaeon]
MAGRAGADARDDIAPVSATLAAGVDVLAGAGQGITELLAKLGCRFGIEYVFLTIYV